jgi:hypothetical protein
MSYFFEKPQTDSTPYVLIDEKNNLLKLAGESYHENVIEVYKEIYEWLNQYLSSDFQTLTFECAMTYYNSSTAKLLFNILMQMDESAADGRKITVNWIVEEENDILMECGEDYKEDMENLTFNIFVKNN